MPVPHFLDIEYCQTDDALFPTAIAWSLDDGRMKTVVIAPDDAWVSDSDSLPDVDLRYLYEQGVPLIELAQVLHEDLPDRTVYVDGLDPDEELVDLIFDAVSLDCPFEVVHVQDLMPHIDKAELEDRRRDIMFSNGLDPQLPENGVYALLLLAQEEDLTGGL